MSDDTLLDETIVDHQPGHAELHSQANAQTNYLTGKVKEIRGLINTGRLSSGEMTRAFVGFCDQEGNPLPAGSVTLIVVNTTTGEIDDILYQAG